MTGPKTGAWAKDTDKDMPGLGRAPQAGQGAASLADGEATPMADHRNVVIQRIMAVLLAHPDGIAAENLLNEVSPNRSRVERQRLVRTLYSLANAGRIRIEGKQRVGVFHETHSDEGAVLLAVYRKPNVFQNSTGYARADERIGG